MSRDRHATTVSAGPDPGPGERWLALRLRRRCYALHVEDVSGVAETAVVRPVPLAPRGVLGLAEWRGRLLTVLDLAELMDDAATDAEPSLVRLATPLEHTALYVPGTLRLASASEPPSDEGVEIQGRLHVPIDPARLVAGLEKRIPSREGG
jgi:hypothetical protein